MTISDIMQEYGLTIKAISDQMKIPYRTVQDWAAGKRTPPEYLPAMINEILIARKERIMTYDLIVGNNGNVNIFKAGIFEKTLEMSFVDKEEIDTFECSNGNSYRISVPANKDCKGNWISYNKCLDYLKSLGNVSEPTRVTIEKCRMENDND